MFRDNPNRLELRGDLEIRPSRYLICGPSLLADGQNLLEAVRDKFRFPAGGRLPRCRVVIEVLEDEF